MNPIKYIFNWRYRYFIKKIDGMSKMIEDLLFKRHKTLYVREQIRKEYDNLKSKLEIHKTKINAEKDKPTLTADEFKRLEDEEVLFNKDIDKKVEQMKQLDMEIYGTNPTAELPEGHQGLNQTMEALRELVAVTKQYIKEL